MVRGNPAFVLPPLRRNVHAEYAANFGLSTRPNPRPALRGYGASTLLKDWHHGTWAPGLLVGTPSIGLVTVLLTSALVICAAAWLHPSPQMRRYRGEQVPAALRPLAVILSWVLLLSATDAYIGQLCSTYAVVFLARATSAAAAAAVMLQLLDSNDINITSFAHWNKAHLSWQQDMPNPLKKLAWCWTMLASTSVIALAASPLPNVTKSPSVVAWSLVVAETARSQFFGPSASFLRQTIGSFFGLCVIAAAASGPAWCVVKMGAAVKRFFAPKSATAPQWNTALGPGQLLFGVPMDPETVRLCREAALEKELEMKRFEALGLPGDQVLEDFRENKLSFALDQEGGRRRQAIERGEDFTFGPLNEPRRRYWSIEKRMAEHNRRELEDGLRANSGTHLTAERFAKDGGFPWHVSRSVRFPTIQAFGEINSEDVATSEVNDDFVEHVEGWNLRPAFMMPSPNPSSFNQQGLQEALGIDLDYEFDDDVEDGDSPGQLPDMANRLAERSIQRLQLTEDD